MGVTSRGNARKHRPTSAQATVVHASTGTTIMSRTVGQTDVAPTQAPSSPSTGGQTGDRQKLDHGKAPWHLAPWDAFLAIVHVLAFGAAKYRARGWEDGMGWDRLFSAAQRHLTDWFMRVDKGRGPGRDADTGYSDLWHCACCVCFLISYELRGMTHKEREGNVEEMYDTRPVVPSNMAQFMTDIPAQK